MRADDGKYIQGTVFARAWHQRTGLVPILWCLGWYDDAKEAVWFTFEEGAPFVVAHTAELDFVSDDYPSVD